MDSNRCSDRWPQGLEPLAEAVDGLARQDLEGLPDAALAEQTLGLRRLLDCLEGQWLQRLAAVDGRGAAGADQGIPAASPASWLRNRLRLGANAASNAVHTARALFRGPLTTTAQALCHGDISAAHAAALAHGTHHLPTQVAAEAEPVLVAAARHLDPPRLRRVIGHLHHAADPTAPTARPSGATSGEASGGPPPSRAWSAAAWAGRSRRPTRPGRPESWPVRLRSSRCLPTPSSGGPALARRPSRAALGSRPGCLGPPWVTTKGRTGF
jgi:Domain of unknown function (DUF222)